ncbi:transcription termination factor Rho [Nibricoccus aquaticus]|uniref:Transcription termination factor Rho n=1 Tax=Nibricoccus aquaticus TaxID=2576891 RepID=A0A290QMR9_9BACT|nr:transcription termination factor Rho [Nibricoccus aquaticus]ATC65482.1 transcription termination factor Rho [Nibricoccus aquaticus]
MADTSSDGDNAAKPKKKPRAAAASTATRAPRAKKAATKAPAKSRAPKEDSGAPELSFAPEPSAPSPAPAPAPEPAPIRAEREERPARAERADQRSEEPPPREREVFTPRREREQPSPSYEAQSPAHDSTPSASDYASPAQASDASASGPSDSTGTPRSHDSNAPSDSQSRPQHGGHHQGGQGGGNDQQHQGGGGRPHNPNEPFWKRDKRGKRNRGGGGGGDRGGKHGGDRGEHRGDHRGGHGGGNWQQQERAPRHPQQPPPPNLNPVFGDLPNPNRFTDLAVLTATATEIASGGGEPLYVDQLYTLNLHELITEARRLGVSFEGAPNRKQLLAAIFKFASDAKRPILDRGYIDLTDKGHGFIVHPKLNYRVYPEDSYLPENFVIHYGLKRGHQVEVQVEAPREGERCPSVIKIDKVMDMAPDDISKVTAFEELVPYYPLQRILLEATDVHKDVSMRMVDILTPVGFGQRGLIVAPPRTGKTVLLQNMANSISNNFPEATLILLLIDERPEEVTDFKRHTKGEVVSSTFDEAPESHVHCAEMVGEKARRLVEQGKHVIILLDSITRLARAYNALASNSGKIMSGGMEATALQRPKRFFGAARNIEGGGSLTIMATALIDTGSRMDEVIFEEFKGTGNMELHLDRGLVDKRIFPAINGDRSGTRKEELIYHPEEIARIHGLRRAMQGIPPVEAMEMLINRLKKTKTNAEFLMSLNR